ncbi:MAG TPA: cation transporter [Polyangiaceae bacterium]|jgi:divalent metal cation (Fe/Co/Zn/Cd) transporter
MTPAVAAPRAPLVARGLQLEALTIGWNVLEGGFALASGLAARSIALTGFGFDSVIEVVAAASLFVRLRAETRGGAARAERRALWVVGISFFLLSAYIALDAGATLWSRRAPDASRVGVLVAALALVVMPLLARAKLRVGEAIGSGALVADAKCSLACAWLSATVLVGVGLNAALGWWWADPVAALLMVPFLVREGREALERAGGKETSCGCHGGCSSS